MVPSSNSLPSINDVVIEQAGHSSVEDLDGQEDEESRNLKLKTTESVPITIRDEMAFSPQLKQTHSRRTTNQDLRQTESENPTTHERLDSMMPLSARSTHALTREMTSPSKQLMAVNSHQGMLNKMQIKYEEALDTKLIEIERLKKHRVITIGVVIGAVMVLIILVGVCLF